MALTNHPIKAHQHSSYPRSQGDKLLEEAFDLSLTLGELLASAEALTRFYIQNTKEYIEMKAYHPINHPAKREKLWLVTNAKTSMEKLHRTVEAIGLRTLLEYREFERDNPPPLP